MFQETFQVAGGSARDNSQQELYLVLSAKMVGNVSALSYGEMEILVEVKGCNPSKSSCYVLEIICKIHTYGAKDTMKPNEFVPVLLLNPTKNANCFVHI